MPAPLSIIQTDLADYLLSLSGDEGNDLQPHNGIDWAGLYQLTDEFYDWQDRMGNVMIENGLGNETLRDLWWKRIEFYYLCVRMGHGCSFTDEPWVNEELGYIVCTLANNIAESQGSIETYRGDDNKLYIL